MPDNMMTEIYRVVFVIGILTAIIGAIMMLVQMFLCVVARLCGKVFILLLVPIFACVVGYVVTLAIALIAMQVGPKLDSFTAVIIMIVLSLYIFGLAGGYLALLVHKEMKGDAVNG